MHLTKYTHPAASQSILPTNNHLPTYLTVYPPWLPPHLLYTHLNTDLPTYLSSPGRLPIYATQIHSLIFPPAHQPTYLPTYIPTWPPPYLIYPLTHLPTTYLYSSGRLSIYTTHFIHPFTHLPTYPPPHLLHSSDGRLPTSPPYLPIHSPISSTLSATFSALRSPAVDRQDRFLLLFFFFFFFLFLLPPPAA